MISIASGWNDSEYGDIKDTHWYPAPNMLPNPVNKRASVCGEYGGITLLIDGHRWIGGSDMKYTQVYSSEELTDKLIGFVNDIEYMKGNGLCAAVYTQLTDLEDEENGLMTYDRKVVKVNDNQLQRIRKAVERNYTYTSKIIVPVSQSSDVQNDWKYYMSDNPLNSDSWKDVDFSDSDWKIGIAGFGKGVRSDYQINTVWDKSYIYLRRNTTFNGVKKADLGKLKLQIYHDEDCEVYINGVLAVSLQGHTNRYAYTNISKEALATIQLDKPNLIAVKCKQTVGEQFIDLGFSLTDIIQK